MEREVGKRKDGSAIIRTWMFLPATLEDNPSLEFQERYREELMAQPPHKRKALLEGDWWVTANSHFAGEWEERVHVCDPFRVPEDWKVFRSMDWGYRKPGVIHWWAMNRDETLYCLKELTFKEKLDHEVAEMVKDVERSMKLELIDGDRSRITGPADNQLWEERGDSGGRAGGKTKAAVFAEHGVSWVKADKRSRQRNFEHLTARLKEHKSSKRSVPGIVFFRTCGHIISWVPSVQTDPDNSECPVDDSNDHWGDSTGYACAYASRGWKGIPARAEKRKPWGDNGPPPAASSGNRMSYYG
jgi:hypothetical protein